MATQIMCDTHVLIFWQDAPDRLSITARDALEAGVRDKILSCSDISFWEIAMLIHSGRLRRDISPVQYMEDLCLVLSLTVLPITPEIASLSQDDFFTHKDPADRLIAATAIRHNAPLITADDKLKELNQLTVIW